MDYRFFAWDKNEKILYKDVVNINFGADQATVCIDEISPNGSYPTFKTIDNPKLLLCSGIFGMNGQEIFDGSIIELSREALRDDFGFKDADKISLIQIASFEAGGFVLRDVNGDIWGDLDYFEGSGDVIGNIFENEDLIKNTKATND